MATMITGETTHRDTTPDPQRLPTFLVIGAQKAGTTSLYHYLNQHPDVHMSPVKEPCFFAFEKQRMAFKGPNGSEAAINSFAVTALEDYQRLFDEAGPAQARGEASTLYLPVADTATRMYGYVPEVRLIALLRNPVDRAYSSYLHARRTGREPESDFARALELEQQRIADNWGFLYRYQTLGRYHDQLKAYIDVFGREALLVLRYDDLIKRPTELVSSVFAFIGVAPDFEPDMTMKHNQSGEPRSLRLQMLIEKPAGIANRVKPLVPASMRTALRGAIQRRNLTRPPLDPGIRVRLQAAFDDDIRRTSELTGLDLSNWLSRP